MNKEYQSVAELVCELTRNCNMKEEYFAASFNLSPTEVRLLKLYAFADVYSIKGIREKLNLTPGRITHILQALEKKNLVIRIPDANDRRSITVKLLPKAAPLIQNLHQNYNKLHEDILKNVKGIEMKNIQESLQALVDVFKVWAAEK